MTQRQRLLAGGLATGATRESRVIAWSPFSSWLRRSDARADAVGGLERIRTRPIPLPDDLFIRVINWVFGTQVLLSFESQVSPMSVIVLFSRPFDQDGSCVSIPMNTISMGINKNLMPGERDYGRYRPSRNPVFWD